MQPYEFPGDQHHFHMRIGIERPLSEMVRNFFIAGEGRLGLPRVTVGEFCEALSTPAQFVAGDQVPLVYLRRGVVHFGSAEWGFDNRLDGSRTNLRWHDRQSIGYPALIPASYIDLVVDPEGSTPVSQALRLRPAHGQHLYLGCTFQSDAFGDAVAVTPFVCDASPPVKNYIDWQPFLVSVAGPPDQRNFDFLLRRHYGRFKTKCESVTAEEFALAQTAAGA